MDTIYHILTGCYELRAINAEIICMRRGNSDITILPSINMLPLKETPMKMRTFGCSGC